MQFSFRSVNKLNIHCSQGIFFPEYKCTVLCKQNKKTKQNNNKHTKNPKTNKQKNPKQTNTLFSFKLCTVSIVVFFLEKWTFALHFIKKKSIYKLQK